MSAVLGDKYLLLFNVVKITTNIISSREGSNIFEIRNKKFLNLMKMYMETKLRKIGWELGIK